MRFYPPLTGLFILFCSFSLAMQLEGTCGVVEAVKEQNFTPRTYHTSEEDFNYIKSLHLRGSLNVLSSAGTTYVNNIFPVGRGSQWLKGKPCLEVCDLIAPHLGFNYRDVSEALHTIQLLGPSILSHYHPYLNWTAHQAYSGTT